MPANEHLTWLELRDFSGGVWTAGDWLMPANAAQIMRDCYPHPSGGLRAFYRRTTLTASTSPTNVGLAPTTELYFGAFAHPSGGINPLSERYLMAWESTTRVAKLYYALSGGWGVPIKSFAATAASPTIKQSFFATYLSGTTRKVVFNLNLGSADDGIWIVTGGGTPTQLVTTGGVAPAGPVTVHQARIVYSDGSNIRWSDVGAETFQTSSFLNVEPSGLRPNNVFMVSYEPSDLMIGKEAGPLVLVQGDITNPTVRSMDNTVSVVAPQVPAKTPLGMVFTAHRDGVYATQGGSAPDKLSKALSPNHFSLPAVFGAYTPSWLGNVAYAEGFLFTPAAIYDLATRAWFTSGTDTPGNVSAPLYVYDRGA